MTARVLTTKIRIGELLFSGILIASLGAVMDVAMSISSTIAEINEKNSQLTAPQLFISGLKVGRDMMGTMSNTLILAFVGGSLSVLVVDYAYNLPFVAAIAAFFMSGEESSDKVADAAGKNIADTVNKDTAECL